MNTATTKPGTELSDKDLEAISGGCYRHCDDDYDCHKRDYCDDDYDCHKRDYCDDDYKDDSYSCHEERPRHCRPRRHHCG